MYIDRWIGRYKHIYLFIYIYTGCQGVLGIAKLACGGVVHPPAVLDQRQAAHCHVDLLAMSSQFYVIMDM